MTKKELKKASDSELIAELASAYADAILAYNIARLGTKRTSKHLDDVIEESKKRGLLEQKEIDRLNA